MSRMRVVNFPRGEVAAREQRWSLELEAALAGDGHGPAADSWRELRSDVRTLAPPLDPALEQRLREEIDRRTAPARRRVTPRRPQLLGHGRAVGAVAGVLLAAVAAVVLLHPGSHSEHLVPLVSEHSAPGVVRAPSKAAADGAAVPAVSEAQAVLASPAAAPGRVQQLSASLTLSTTPSNVQAISDGVARLTARDGGYVASSHVQVGQAAGEASLTLSLPSARLSGALAELGRIAPVRSESQALQDITNAYDSARQQLTDASAERRALLRALSRASSQGQIDSLREQLSQNRDAIARDQARLHAVARRASNAEVEVTVLGSAHAESGGLTIHRGLHDAGRVLTVALAVLVIAAAVLVPLALAGIALALVARALARYRRERVLDAS
jgi:vacuolar-type H+-ATPase subunit H